MLRVSQSLLTTLPATLLAACAVCTVLSSSLRAQSPSCPAGPVVLVLSGGGSKGIAHVGVLQHLDSLGVVPDMVVGASIGAMVGGMYASGWSATDLKRFVFRYNVGKYIGGYAPRAPSSLGLVRPLLTWQEGDAGSLNFSTSAVREANVNLIVSAMMLAGDLRAAGDFDRLPTRFRAVATDLTSGEPVVLRDGDLAKAVRASFAIPLVFPPVTLDGRILIDGGVAENAPVQSARDELVRAGLARSNGPMRVILSEMVDSVPVVVERGTTMTVASSLLRFLFTQDQPALQGGDITISSHTTGVSPLDFSNETMHRLIASGRQAARNAIPNATCLPTRPRVVPPLPSLAARRYNVRPSSATLRLGEFVFRGGTPNATALDTVMDRLARVGDGEILNALWLTPQPAQSTPGAPGVTDSIVLAPELVFVPRRSVAAGLVFDGELGARAWVGGVSRRDGGLPIELAARGGINRYRQDLMLAVRRSEQDIQLVRSPFAELVVASERLRFFDTDDGELEVTDALLPAFHDQQLRAGVEQPLGARWTLQAAVLGRVVTTVRPTDSTFDDRTLHVLGATLRLGRTRAENFVPRVEIDVTNRYTRVLAASASALRAGAFAIDIATRAVWADGDQPLLDATTLGGAEGMAGLPIYSRRGRTELSGLVDVGRAVRGPLAVQVTFMGGQVSQDSRRPLAGDPIAGVRVGVGARSPVGPVRLQYGVNTDGRRHWYVRVGQWF